MRNLSIFRRVLSFVLVLMLSFPVMLSSLPSSFAAPSKKSDKVIKISVDPRIELLTVVQYLVFGSWQMSEYDTNYAGEVEEKFYPFWKHPVLNQYWSMYYYGDFVNNVPHDLMLHLSEPPELEVRIPIPKEMVKRAGGEKSLNDFLDFLRDFAKKTKFMDFFDDHRELYETHVEAVTKEIEKEDYVALLEGYYGSGANGYAILLGILMYEGGFGVSVGGTMYAIIGPCNSADKEPVFAEPSYLYNTSFHLFGYSFIGPLSSKIIEEIKRCEKLINPVYKPMREILYPLSPTWEVCMNEHLIRAVTIRILASKNGPEETAKKIKEAYGWYFVYIEYVLDLLDVYEKNRDIYPAFADFFPRIQNKFEEICEFPYIPTFLTTNHASQNGVQLVWNDNSFDESGFFIYRKEKEDTHFVVIGQVPANQMNFRDNEVKIGKSYVYRVAAKGEKGQIFSNSSFATISVSKPYPPTNFKTVLDEEKNTLTFSWDYPFYADGFKLIEINKNRTVISDIAPDKGEYTIDIPAKGEHLFVITAWVKGEKEVFWESFDSEVVLVMIQ